MDWNTFYQENHTVIIGGTFTLLGIVIGWLLNLCQSYFTNKRTDRLHMREKREEIYIQALSCCLNIPMDITYLTTGIPSDTVKRQINDIAPKMKIFATTKVWKQYHLIQKELQNCPTDDIGQKMESFINAIRKELGLKD